MATSRYYFRPTIDGRTIATTSQTTAIFNAVDGGQIQSSVYQLALNQRLDQLAGSVYGDSSLWWIIAAANNIHNAKFSFPDGTILRIPVQYIEIVNNQTNI